MYEQPITQQVIAPYISDGATIVSNGSQVVSKNIPAGYTPYLSVVYISQDANDTMFGFNGKLYNNIQSVVKSGGKWRFVEDVKILTGGVWKNTNTVGLNIGNNWQDNTTR